MTLTAFIITSDYATAITVAAAILAAYSAVAYSQHRRTTLLAVLAGAVIIMVAYPGAGTQVPSRYATLLVLLPTAAVGNMMRMWRERAADSAERLRLAQAAHQAETRRALETERARIASELHDVVTHNVSVMVVQAGAARRVLDTPASRPHGALPAEVALHAEDARLAREALLAIEASGRSAMTELRHMLGLLTPAAEAALPGTANGTDAGTEAAACAETTVDGAAHAADDGTATLRPQPGMDQVPALVDRVRAAGLEAELSVTGTVRVLPPGLDLAAYRVIQEALTNVLKHAGQARSVIHVEYRSQELRITVRDDGRPTGAGHPGYRPPPSGRGLIGLRERIAVYHGKLDAGPRPGGGWQVSAKVPLEPVAGGLDGTRHGSEARSSAGGGSS